MADSGERKGKGFWTLGQQAETERRLAEWRADAERAERAEARLAEALEALRGAEPILDQSVKARTFTATEYSPPVQVTIDALERVRAVLCRAEGEPE